MLQHLSLSSLVLSILILYLGYLLLQIILDPLKDIPGPLFARFNRLWYLFAIYRGNFEIINIELHRKYGSIVRIAPNEYSIDDYEAAKIIYGPGAAFIKAPWYGAWAPPSRTNLFADQDPAHHAAQKRKFASAYSMSSLVGYEPFVNECTSLLAQRFNELAGTKQTINLGRWLQFYAFDVIGFLTFGKRFGFLDIGEDKTGIIKAIEGRSTYCTFVGIYPLLHKYLLPYLPKTGGYGYMLKFSQDALEAREQALKDPHQDNNNGPADFVTKFLSIHSASPDKLTKDDISIVSTSNIGAGSDTTAITLSAIFYHLLKNPSTYHCLQAEIDTAAREGKLSEQVTLKEAQDLSYLQAVIKEALRVHPATGLPLSRVVPPHGSTIKGRVFPPGTTVGINSWVAHRNYSVYGPDADLWRPERWLEFEEQGRGAEIEKYSMAFGLGSRTCIGKNISVLEMSKLVPQLLRRFDFVLDKSLQNREWKSQNRWFVKQMDFEAKIVLRDIAMKA